MASGSQFPLYARGSHTFSRALAVGAVGMTAIGLVFGAYELSRTGDLVGLAFVAFIGLVGYSAARTILRARPIFGSAEGLVVGAGAERRPSPGRISVKPRFRWLRSTRCFGCTT